MPNPFSRSQVNTHHPLLLEASQKCPGQSRTFKLSYELVDNAKVSGDVICSKELEMKRRIELLRIFINDEHDLYRHIDR